MTTPEIVTEAWALAESRGDVTALDGLLDADFRGIGPRGFVLDRSQWLARFEQPFAVERLSVEQLETREFDDTAIVVGLQDQVASYRGFRADGRFRLCLVLRRRSGPGWVVVGVQLSGPVPPMRAG